MQLLTKNNRDYLKTITALAIPLVLQNLLTASMSLIDNIMVGALGDVALAAINISTQFYMRFFHVIIFGLVSGASILIAQFWGVHDVKNIRRVMGLQLIAGSSLGIIFTLLTSLIPGKILNLYSNDPAVIQAGSLYLSTFSLIFLFHPVSMIYANAHRATGNTRLPMLAISLSLVVKLLLNYLLIYGNFGFPELGIAGASLSTLIAKAIELSLLLFFTYRKESPVSARIKEMLDFNSALTKKTIRNVFPVVLNEGLWGIGTNIYSAIYANISTTAIAAVSAVSPVDTMMFAFFYSIGDACAILIGNLLGRGDNAKAYEYAKKTIILSGITAALTGLLVFLFTDQIIGLYSLSSEAYGYARILLVILCASLWIRAIVYATIIGIMRPGGDVKFCLVIDLSAIWLVGIPISLILAHVFHFPITIVYLGFIFDEIYKLIVITQRFRSKKWMNTLTGPV